MTTTTMQTTRYRIIESPIGPLTIAGDGETITNLTMDDQSHPPRGTDAWRRDDSAFDDVVAQLDAYFEGDLREFDVPLQLAGTEFQQRVWNALLDIPYGETESYGQLATRIGQPTAFRAVGLANGRNPVAIIVPCHRVIGSSGSLIGYGGGLDRKRALLDLERGDHSLFE
jgi:methylated-DNA-[protein]-cysteine S-methyltransferase